jgi:hypothetical protein
MGYGQLPPNIPSQNGFRPPIIPAQNASADLGRLPPLHHPSAERLDEPAGPLGLEKRVPRQSLVFLAHQSSHQPETHSKETHDGYAFVLH